MRYVLSKCVASCDAHMCRPTKQLRALNTDFNFEHLPYATKTSSETPFWCSAAFMFQPHLGGRE